MTQTQTWTTQIDPNLLYAGAALRMWGRYFDVRMAQQALKQTDESIATLSRQIVLALGRADPFRAETLRTTVKLLRATRGEQERALLALQQQYTLTEAVADRLRGQRQSA